MTDSPIKRQINPTQVLVSERNQFGLLICWLFVLRCTFRLEANLSKTFSACGFVIPCFDLLFYFCPRDVVQLSKIQPGSNPIPRSTLWHRLLLAQSSATPFFSLPSWWFSIWSCSCFTITWSILPISLGKLCQSIVKKKQVKLSSFISVLLSTYRFCNALRRFCFCQEPWTSDHHRKEERASARSKKRI